MKQYSVVIEETITNIYLVSVEATDVDQAEIFAHAKVELGEIAVAETETYYDTESITEEN